MKYFNECYLFFLIEAWTTDESTRIMLASTSAPRFQLRLIAGDTNTSVVHIRVEIQDKFNCVTQDESKSVVVMPDTENIKTLINAFEQSSINENTSDEIFNLPEHGRQHAFRQMLTSISKVMNDMSSENIANAVTSKYIKYTVLTNHVNIFFLLKMVFLLLAFLYPH